MTNSSTRPVPPKPQPVPSPESAPYWRAARNHQLRIPFCNTCGKFWFPPSCLCPHCLSDDTGWREVSGLGRVHSHAAFHRAFHPAFAHDVPYAVAVIELDEGPRLVSNIVGIGPEGVRCGMRVKVTYDDVTPDVTLPKFTPHGA